MSLTRTNRFRVPAHPPRDRSTCTVLQRQTPTTVTAFASTGWHADPNDHDIERNTFTLHTSDGQTERFDAEVRYGEGVRSSIMEAIVSRSPEGFTLAQAALNHRNAAVAEVYRAAGRTYGSLPKTSYPDREAAS